MHVVKDMKSDLHDCAFGGLQGGLSAQEYAAIHLKVPSSGTDWLDKLIKESRLMDMATAAMPLVANTPNGSPEQKAGWAIDHARRMFAEFSRPR